MYEEGYPGKLPKTVTLDTNPTPAPASTHMNIVSKKSGVSFSKKMIDRAESHALEYSRSSKL